MEPESGISRQGLFTEHIQDGMPGTTGIQRRLQVFFNDQVTAGNVDQYSIVFHLRQETGVDHVTSCLVRGTGQHHHIRGLQCLAHGVGLAYSIGQVGISLAAPHCRDMHAKGFCASRHLLANVTKANNHPACSAQLAKAQVFPVARRLVAGKCRQVMKVRQHMSHHVLGDGDGLADWLLVTRQGRWQGFITDAPLQQLPVQRWEQEQVGDHLQPLDQLPQISAEAPLWQAVLRLDQPDTPRLLVMGSAGLPSGTLERPELAERVLEKLGVRLPPPILEAARRQGVYPLGMGLAPVARSIESSGEG